MGAGPGEGLERRRLGLRLGKPGQRLGSRDLVGVGLLFLDQPLNRDPTELIRLSREGFARSVVASERPDVTDCAGDAAGTNVSALKVELAELFPCSCQVGIIAVLAHEVVTAGLSGVFIVWIKVSDEAFSDEGRPERPSRNLLN